MPFFPWLVSSVGRLPPYPRPPEGGFDLIC
nr:MAG TPA: hypothetical protein [Caudoviricetes sp.]